MIHFLNIYNYLLNISYNMILNVIVMVLKVIHLKILYKDGKDMKIKISMILLKILINTIINILSLTLLYRFTKHSLHLKMLIILYHLIQKRLVLIYLLLIQISGLYYKIPKILSIKLNLLMTMIRYFLNLLNKWRKMLKWVKIWLKREWNKRN
jgi:hypothetical protein